MAVKDNMQSVNLASHIAKVAVAHKSVTERIRERAIQAHNAREDLRRQLEANKGLSGNG
jgi:hypothetical protein